MLEQIATKPQVTRQGQERRLEKLPLPIFFGSCFPPESESPSWPDHRRSGSLFCGLSEKPPVASCPRVRLGLRNLAAPTFWILVYQ